MDYSSISPLDAIQFLALDCLPGSKVLAQIKLSYCPFCGKELTAPIWVDMDTRENKVGE